MINIFDLWLFQLCCYALLLDCFLVHVAYTKWRIPKTRASSWNFTIWAPWALAPIRPYWRPSSWIHRSLLGSATWPPWWWPVLQCSAHLQWVRLEINPVEIISSGCTSHDAHRVDSTKQGWSCHKIQGRPRRHIHHQACVEGAHAQISPITDG